MQRLAITLLFLTPFELAAAPRTSVTALPPKLVKKLKKITGSRALDCGTVDLNLASQDFNNCALSAFRDRKPFFIFYLI